MRHKARSIRVLHVDDEPDFAELVATYVKREDDRFDVETATNASEGRDRLASDDFDCIVSDYDMRGENGIEFLETVREEYPDLPFILYTGKGSEEVASEAISAGVTEYLQKESGTSQYEVLAKRIENAVGRQRAQEAVAESERRLQTIAENTNDILWKFTANWEELLFINSPYEKIWGRSIDELRDEPGSFLKGIHPAERGAVKDAMGQLSAGESVDIEYRVNADEDYGRWVWVQGEPVRDEYGEVEKVVGFARDITTRKEREQELAEQRADLRLFERVVEASTDLIGAVDTEYNFIFANELHRTYHGFKENDIVGQPAAEVIGESWESEVKSRIDRAIAGEEVQFEMERTGADGVTRSFDIQYYPIPGENGTIVGVVGTMRDITERKEQEGKREQIIERVTDAIVEVDADWRFRLVNEQAEELYDMSEESLLGRDFWDVFEEAKGTRFEDEYLHAMETRENTSFTEYFSQLDGWFDIKVYPRRDGGLEFYFIDVTEQQEREQELQKRTNQLQDIIDTVEAAMWIRNAEGEYEYMNQYHRDLFDIADDLDIARKQPTDLHPAEVAEQFQQNDQRVYATEEPVEIEETVETHDGPRDFLTRIVPLFDNGSVYATCGIATDVTKQKRRERQLEQFASIVSHDLRNPLSVAAGRLELVSAECDSEHLDDIERAHDRMAMLIDDLLTLARSEMIADTASVDLGSLVEGCWANVETADSMLVAGIEAVVQADESRLKQVFENLMRNAIKHGCEGVTVTVGALPDGFFVEDDGPGIPLEAREDIFDAGYSTTEDGTGFGLSIVKQIVDAHDWSLGVTEGSDGGARFEITGVEFAAE